MRKKTLFYFLGFFSALTSTVMTTMDIYVSAIIIPNPWIYGLSSFIVGTLVSWMLMMSLTIKVGQIKPAKMIDPNFLGIRLISIEELPFHILAGLGNSVSTAGYFIVIFMTKDPSTVLAFSQLVVIYLLLGEQLIEKDTPTIAEIQAISMVTIGGILASITPEGALNLQALMVVLTVINGGKLMQVLALRKLRTMRHKGLRVDSINIRLWNLVFTTFFFAIITYLIDTRVFIDSLNVSVTQFTVLAIVMLLALAANLSYIRALGIGKSSVVQAVVSSSTIMGIPISIALSNVYPNVYPQLTLSSVIFFLKFSGAILITLGITSLALSEVRAYILIKMKKGRIRESLSEMWKIKGIEKVSFVAGEYDVILKVKTRSIGKAYSKIVRKLEKIEGVEDYLWMSTLREIESI